MNKVPKCINQNGVKRVCRTPTCTQKAFICGVSDCTCQDKHTRCDLINWKGLIDQICEKGIQNKTFEEYTTKIQMMFIQLSQIIEKQKSIFSNWMQQIKKQYKHSMLMNFIKNDSFQKITPKLINDVKIEIKDFHFNIKNIQELKKIPTIKNDIKQKIINLRSNISISVPHIVPPIINPNPPIYIPDNIEIEINGNTQILHATNLKLQMHPQYTVEQILSFLQGEGMLKYPKQNLKVYDSLNKLLQKDDIIGFLQRQSNGVIKIFLEKK